MIQKFFLVVVLVCLSINYVMAADAKLFGTGPSLIYSISDVRIELTYIENKLKKEPVTIRLVSIENSKAISAIQKNITIVPVKDEEFLSLLSRFYKINFFNMPEDFNKKYSVVLNNDRSVSTSVVNLKDRVTNTICFLENKYRKCVIFDENSSKELSEISEIIKNQGRLNLKNSPKL